MSSVVLTGEEKFISFDKDKDRLDSFMGNLMQGNETVLVCGKFVE